MKSATLEQFLGKILKGGLICCLLFVILGGVFYLYQQMGQDFPLRFYQSPPEQGWSFLKISAELSVFSPQGFIALGLLFLVGLQIARMAVVIAYFVSLKERLFTVFSVGIFLLLLALFLVPLIS